MKCLFICINMTINGDICIHIVLLKHFNMWKCHIGTILSVRLMQIDACDFWSDLLKRTPWLIHGIESTFPTPKRCSHFYCCFANYQRGNALNSTGINTIGKAMRAKDFPEQILHRGYKLVTWFTVLTNRNLLGLKVSCASYTIDNRQ